MRIYKYTPTASIKHHSFTLVEMLVVIAIISILASMLLPAINKTVDLAHSVHCKNNLKQSGIAFSNYAGDYNGFLPSIDYPYGTGSNLWCLESGPLVTEYLSDSILFGGNDTLGYSGKGCPSDSYSWEYSMNWYIGHEHMKQAKIKSPSGTFIVCDNRKSYGVYPSSTVFSQKMWRHNYSINILYADGHTESQSYFNISAFSRPFWISW